MRSHFAGEQYSGLSKVESNTSLLSMKREVAFILIQSNGISVEREMSPQISVFIHTFLMIQSLKKQDPSQNMLADGEMADSQGFIEA